MTTPASTLGGPLPGLLQLDHVGVAVADLEAALSLYTTVLGLRLLHREDIADQDVAEAMLIGPASPGGLIGPASPEGLIGPASPGGLIGPASPGGLIGPASPWETGAQVQLLAPLSDRSPVNRFLQRRGPGLHHLAYRVNSVESASVVLRRRGLRLLYDSARAGTRGSLINFVHPKDTGGVLLEIVEAVATDERRG